MVRRDEKVPLRILALSVLLALAAAVLRAGGPARIQAAAADGGSAVERSLGNAVRDAAAKLSGDRCRQVFSDFHDGSGRLLQETLDRVGQTGAAYLGSTVLFYDGHGYERCDDPNVIASTSPGSRVVYICSPQFLDKQRHDPGLAAALLIHEELHSLGLGEDPPTSKQITARVISRCGK